MQPQSVPYPTGIMDEQRFAYQSSSQLQQELPQSQQDISERGLQTSGSADGINYQVLYRDVNSIVQCHLQPHATINITAGAMAAMSANLKLEGKVKLKNMFTPGKTCSSTVTAANGSGTLILAPPTWADVMPLKICEGQEWKVGERCCLAYTPGVRKSTTTQGLGKALFSGEGLFVTKLSGSGVAFITSLGAIHAIGLEAGQEYVVDNEHLVAWNASMNYTIENVGNIMTSIVSSEGKICRFSGPGTILMQTRSPGALASYIRSLGVGGR